MIINIENLFIRFYLKGVDIDDLQNKRIRCIGEIMVTLIRSVIIDMRNIVFEKISTSYFKLSKFEIFDSLVNNQIYSKLKFFLSVNPLSQLMDERNEVAEISHKRRINNRITQLLTNLPIREIHSSQLGRICPIETAEGKRAGLVLNFSSYFELSESGFIQTVFFL